MIFFPEIVLQQHIYKDNFFKVLNRFSSLPKPVVTKPSPVGEVFLGSMEIFKAYTVSNLQRKRDKCI